MSRFFSNVVYFFHGQVMSPCNTLATNPECKKYCDWHNDIVTNKISKEEHLSLMTLTFFHHQGQSMKDTKYLQQSIKIICILCILIN